MFSLQYAPKQQPGRPSTIRRSTTSRPIVSHLHTPPQADTAPQAHGARSARSRVGSQALRAILDDAATRPLDDGAGWARLAVSARHAIDELIALGHVAAALRIAEDEPSVVVRRTVAAAWRQAVRSIGDDAIGDE